MQVNKYFADVIDFHCLRIADIQGQQRVSGRPGAAAGSWFVLKDLMDEVLGQRPSTAPPSSCLHP